MKYDPYPFSFCVLAYYGHNSENGEIRAISGYFLPISPPFTAIISIVSHSLSEVFFILYIKIWKIHTQYFPPKWLDMARKWPFSSCTKVPLVGTLNLYQEMPDIMQKELGQTDQLF